MPQSTSDEPAVFTGLVEGLVEWWNPVIDRTRELSYLKSMGLHVTSREKTRAYYTAPWRKARILARFVLHPELTYRERYARMAAALTSDPSVTNRLISQAVAHLQGKTYQRGLAA